MMKVMMMNPSHVKVGQPFEYLEALVNLSNAMILI